MHFLLLFALVAVVPAVLPAPVQSSLAMRDATKDIIAARAADASDILQERDYDEMWVERLHIVVLAGHL